MSFFFLNDFFVMIIIATLPWRNNDKTLLLFLFSFSKEDGRQRLMLLGKWFIERETTDVWNIRQPPSCPSLLFIPRELKQLQ